MANRTVIASYESRAAEYAERAALLRKRALATSNARLAIFLIVFVVLIFVEGNTVLFIASALIGTALFIGAVALHRRVRAEMRDCEARAALCALGIARIERDWPAMSVVLNSGTPNHPYADDIDLFGAPSVSQLFGPVRTLHGARTLRSWLEHPANINAITERQAAVKALARDFKFRETLAVNAGSIPRPSHRRVNAFLGWIESPAPKLPLILVLAARVLPLLTLASIVLAATGLLPPVWVYAPVLTSILVTVFAVPRAYRAFNAAFTDEPAPLNYAATFAAAQRAPTDTALLARLHNQLHAGGAGAAQSIRKLEQIMHSSDARRSGIFALVLEVLLLWSPNVLIALERWRRERGRHAAGWFAALGEVEALSSMATLAYDNPAWCFPVLDPNADCIAAEKIGHPMLSDDVRVPNDVRIGPKGTLLLVTGSNMSGKSTLLRAVGVNTVLAHAGAPVCAGAYTTPPVRLFTSINVRDSLAMGASLYMAQLARLKEIVDAARHAQPDEMCCYLLDEILSGTNSADRTTAVRAIVHELLQLNAIGALTTHDLALAADERIARHATPIHFTETIDSTTASMTFDYRIRPGIVQSSNALALMKLMGFRIDA